MNHMWVKPRSVWILPMRGDGEVHALPQSDLEGVFRHYSDTGYEPKLNWLYETMGCRTVDLRDLPGLGHLWIDDEGLLRSRETCPVGTMLYQTAYGVDHPIVGTCVLVVYPEASNKGTDQVVRRAQKIVNDRKKSAN